MSLVTVIWSMVAAACLTLAAIHFPVWWRNRGAQTTLAFALAAVSTAALAFCELVMLKAATPREYATAVRWAHVPIALLLVALAGFAFHYLDAGRRWLAATAIGMRLVSLVLNFATGQNLNWLEVRELRPITFLGDAIVVPVGVTNPWMAVGQLSLLLLLLFFADASLTAWRRGRRAAAVLVGGILSLLVVFGGTWAVILYWGGLQAPQMISLFALGIVVVMAYALSADLLRAKSLAVELGESEQRAALAAEAANLGTFTRDMVRDVIEATPKWRSLFGFAEDEPLNLDALMRKVHVDDRVSLGESMARAIRGDGEQHTEFRVPLPDGRMRWIGVIGRVDVDGRGRPVRSRGVCIDITSRKQAEQETLRLRQDIAHVGRVSVMGQLASSLAHEINQPLGAILRNAEAAALFMQDPSPDLHEITAILEDIRKDDQRAGAVIDRMRALLRRKEVEMKPVDVTQMLGDVAALLRPDAATRHIGLEIELPSDSPPLLGDRVQIQQVLLNLILNGMDALGPESSSPRKVAVTTRRLGFEALEFSVADTGCGIAAEQIDRIFDPFFTTKTSGIGMGLSISRDIVEAHGGHLWAENNAEGGATFRFTVRLAGAAVS